ncbi:MAG: hypothetical protein COV52_00945 [Gammaproteobacteria bacterium CG11_big_fil_rev_8_21_14_0_20_46_22]|nr:MAG: hypothetical protein COW05_03045 [Gammaproteobacteria bacterium CG12_big_fil_rev_8_21_14_0_65_46_12]PIR11984.1 MAG: hypothetical protein COV52_00945 [Gammaproteobacteria bacterium CG11_big_fil_rev_8_21_14_0_20_46_22]
MQFVEDTHNALYRLTHVDDTGFTVNGKHYSESLMIGNELFIPDWPPQTISDLNASHWQIILEQTPDILLIGTGKQREIIDDQHLSPLYEQRIAFDIMNTRAACRTLAVLQAEGRHVIAALLR